MNKLMRSLTLTVAGAIVTLAGSGPLHAQGGGTGAFKWYVGGHGGLMSFRTNVQGRQFLPTAGGQLLITAKRTGLLLSVDQAFGSDEPAAGFYNVVDTSGSVIEGGTIQYTFQGLRKYTAALVAYPVRNRTVQPFVGIGVGLIHSTTHTPGIYADGAAATALGSSGFGTGLGGLEFRIGRLSAFGMWQITTKSGYKELSVVLQRDGEGKPLLTRTDFGEIFRGATHTLVGGLRFSLGSARESGVGSD